MTKKRETAFEKGRKDCLAGVAMSKNPYRGNRKENWQSGWESVIDEKIAAFDWKNGDLPVTEQRYFDEMTSLCGIPKKYLGSD